MTDRRDQALELFAPLGPSYDRLGALLSFGQDPRWRRAMVSRVPRDGGTVLDVATGTGLVAERLLAAGHRGHGARPEPGHARGGAAPVRRPRRARRGVGDRDPVPGRLVRPPHVHVPAPLRRRSRRDAAPSSPASSGRAARSRTSSSASRAASGGRSGISTSASASRRRPHPRRAGTTSAASSARRSAASTSGGRSSASSSCGGRRASTDVRARRMSLGGGVVIWGTRT